MRKKNIIAVSVLLVTFVISTLLFLLNDYRYTRLTFKFENELSEKIVYEDRFVLLKGDVDNRNKIIIDELFLGPHSVFNRKIVPYDFKYNKLIFNNKKIYMDLPLSFLNINESEDVYKTLDLIKGNISLNIKNISDVIITIDGQSIDSWPSENRLPQGE